MMFLVVTNYVLSFSKGCLAGDLGLNCGSSLELSYLYSQ